MATLAEQLVGLIKAIKTDITALYGHKDSVANPHGVTKAQVGLASVDNTSDANKPVSTAQQAALDLKAADAAVVHLTGAEVIAGLKTFNMNPAPPSPGFADTALHVVGANTAGARTLLDSFGGTPNSTVRRANGTAAAPTALALDNAIGAFAGMGYGATGYSSGQRASLRFSAAQAWTDTAQGTYASVYTTPNGSTTARECLRVSDAGDISAKVLGAGFRVTEGANAKQGSAVLVAGTVTVANTSVTANSRIFLTSQTDGGAPGFLRVSARVAGTGFTILSSDALDTSTVAYEIFEPA